ncbi:MAG: Ig-like domain-containing protein [bacterium]
MLAKRWNRCRCSGLLIVWLGAALASCSPESGSPPQSPEARPSEQDGPLSDTHPAGSAEPELGAVPAGIHSGSSQARTELRVELLPRLPRVGDTIRVELDPSEPDPCPMPDYHWSVNEVEIQEERGETFAGAFKRGDTVSVLVGCMGEPDGAAPGRASVTVGNSPPAVRELAGPRFDGQSYETRVVASDPDGDPLDFAVVEGPKGLEIDSDGKISWRPPEQELGEHTILISVKDSAGGEIVYTYSFVLAKEQPPAPPEEL